VLRHWLKGLGVRASQAQLLELQQQIQACTTRGHRIHIKVGEGFVHRVGDGIDWYNP
jgi:tRNA(Ile)-lysidine synthase